MSSSIATRSADADDVLNEVISSALEGVAPVVIVESPPGAGKTFLVECAVAYAMSHKARVLCITPGVKQAYDIAERLLGYDDLPRIVLMHAKHRQLPAKLVSTRVTEAQGWNPAFNAGPGVIVANAHVLAAYLERIPTHTFDFMIVDEAYQLAARDFMPIADMAPRTLMVGDPGQLPPVHSTDTTNMEVGEHRVHWPAPAYVLNRFPGTPVFKLPVTRRLLPDTASLVQRAFYKDLPFTSLVDPARRRLTFELPGIDRVADGALDAIANGASMAAIVLPGAAPAHEEVDIELASAMAHVARHILDRRAVWGQKHIEEKDIACIDPHVLAGGAISDNLRRAGIGNVRVDTVERWQGLEVPITIARHPLSCIGQPTAFDLQAGRWCVTLSRHQIGCIIIARASVAEVLRNYVHSCDTAAAGAKDEIWAGYESHRFIWSELERQGRIFHV